MLTCSAALNLSLADALTVGLMGKKVFVYNMSASVSYQFPPLYLGRVRAFGDDVSEGLLNAVAVANLSPSPLRHPIGFQRPVEQHHQTHVRLETGLV